MVAILKPTLWGTGSQCRVSKKRRNVAKTRLSGNNPSQCILNELQPSHVRNGCASESAAQAYCETGYIVSDFRQSSFIHISCFHSPAIDNVLVSSNFSSASSRSGITTQSSEYCDIRASSSEWRSQAWIHILPTYGLCANNVYNSFFQIHISMLIISILVQSLRHFYLPTFMNASFDMTDYIQ